MIMTQAEKPFSKEFIQQKRLRRENDLHRDRLLLLAEKSHALGRHSTNFSPELRPKMGLRAKDKVRSSMFVSEQSLPDKLTQALKHLRPGALVHSASSSTPFRVKNKGVVAADDVLYIASPETKTNSTQMSRDEIIKRRHHSILVHACPSHSDLLVQSKDPTLKNLDQIRNLYKSVPNVSTLEDNDFERPSRYSKYDDEMSSSTRSPTDSGYRSTPRHLTQENPYSLDEANDIGISHKTTTVVHVNGDFSPALSHSEKPRMRAHGVNLGGFDDAILGYGIVPEPTTCPVSERDVVAVLQGRRCRSLGQVDLAVVPRLVELTSDLMSTMVDHIERLSHYSPKITTDDIATTTKVIFPLDVFSSCLQSASQACALLAMSGTGALKRSLHQRADLRLPVGKIYRWMIDRFPRKPITDDVACYVTAVLECSIEELVRKIVELDVCESICLTNFEERMGQHKSLCSFFRAHDSLANEKHTTQMTYGELLDVVTSVRQRILAVTEGSMSSYRSRKRSQMKLSKHGGRSLHYFTGYSPFYSDSDVPLADWIRLIFAFAEHRLSSAVDDCDVQQAARLLLGLECAPPSLAIYRTDMTTDGDVEETTTNFYFSMICSADAETRQRGLSHIHDRLHTTNQYGLCLLSEAIVKEKHDVVETLVAAGSPLDLSVPKSSSDKRPFLLNQYTGWRPITWAIGTQQHKIAEMLINSGASAHDDQMLKDSPLQIAVQLGDYEAVSLLLNACADPFRTSVTYCSTKASFRNLGCPSALALACIRGNSQIIDLLLERASEVDHESTVEEFLSEENKRKDDLTERTDFENLSSETRMALHEAMYYAVETSRPEIACELVKKVNGLTWNSYTWTRALQGAAEMKNKCCIEAILSSFGPKIATELNDDNIDFCLSVLFSLLKSESRRESGDPWTAAMTISRLWQYFGGSTSDRYSFEQSSSHVQRSQIDESFVNNEHLSDVRFLVEGEIVFGHRIVLFNSSERFRKLLQSPSGVVTITDISHKAFMIMMEFLYTGKLRCDDVPLLFSLMPVADLYFLPALKNEVLRNLASKLSTKNVAALFQFAIVHTTPVLLSDCERFVLEHFGTVCRSKRMKELVATSNTSDHFEYDICCALSSRLASAFVASKTRSDQLCSNQSSFL